MSGDLDILKETPSIRLKSAKGTAHLWFMNNDGSERGVVWSPENNESLGEIHIRAKNTKVNQVVILLFATTGGLRPAI